MSGPRVLLSNYIARVISRGPGILSSFSHPSWVVFRVLQNLIGAPWSSYRHAKSIFQVLKALFILAPASAGHIGVFHAVSYSGSHSGGWSEVSFSFVPGFVAKTRDLAPVLLVLRALLYRPNQTRVNRNERLLYPVRAVRCYLDCFAAHRQRCERFLFAAGCSTKELLKTTVSWLRMPLSQICWLSVMDQSVCVS